MRRFAATLIPLLLAISSGSASAIDLPVSYLVDGKDLKSLAPAGTNITFELFSDAACTSSVFSSTVDIDTVSVGIETLKLASVKGSAKPPKPVRINAVLAGVTPTSQLYLKVTGTGVTPVNGTCQVQVAGVPGPPGGMGSCTWVTGSPSPILPTPGNTGSATASCTGGDLLFSGGCQAPTSAAITSSTASDATTWSCQALRVFTEPAVGSVTAKALCCTP